MGAEATWWGVQVKSRLIVLCALFLGACVSTRTNEPKPETAAAPQTAAPQASYEEKLPDDIEITAAYNLAPDIREVAQSRDNDVPKYEPGAIFSLIKDPEVLREIESRGFYFQRHLGMNGKDFVSNGSLTDASSSYRSITKVLSSDVDELLASERAARGANGAGVGMKYNVRLFDAGWFRSKIANYQLVGIMNRLDRVAFNSKSCGELRFVYRLGYDQGRKGIQSRLPMTILVKYMVEGQAHPAQEWDLCKRMVSKWTYPDRKQMTKDQLVDWMTSDEGPLAGEFTRESQLHSIEVNLQALRIPAAARPQFGGHANYLMRVFKRTSEAPTADFEPTFLENTPDVDRIRKTPELLASLKALMKDRKVANRIDHGIFVLPEEFQAKRAYSYSPMGLDRQDNRLYNKLLDVRDFDPKHFVGGRFVKTPDAAIRRLNDLSCVGCHQGRATAGFHFLGIDRKDIHDFNALIFEGSGHFQLELKRRQTYLERVAKSLVPDPGRDFSFAPPLGEPASYANFCGLPGSKSFSHWKCGAGLECRLVDGVPGEKELGKCFPKILRAGALCVKATVTQDGHRSDKLVDLTQLTCGDAKKHYGCSEVKGGFPSGMCNTNCQGLDPKSEVCAQVAGSGFTDCIAQKKPFEQCIEKIAHSGRGLCNEKLACRNDYVCARSENGKGNCTPTYFLFQVRLDGHPNPL